jgi:hypothetical protein
MSATLPQPQLDLREQLARIDRAAAETQKRQAESYKLNEEFRRELWVVGIVTAVFAFIGSAAGDILPQAVW